VTQRTKGAAIRFDVTLSTIGASTVVRLPETASKDLPSRGQVAVHGTINGAGFQTVLEPDGNSGHWMRVDDTLQHAAGIGAGDTAALGIEVTRDWPEPSMPGDLAAALAAAPQEIQSLWNQITPMARWEWVRWVNATKNPDTRGRRVEVSISKMNSGKSGPAVSTSPHAPTRTCRRTAGSSSQGTTAPDRRSEHVAGRRQPECSGCPAHRWT
jgi:Domain of unknown function (DUF1905)/Bacteriocin-protection, YdeI or OmpD-Associated